MAVMALKVEHELHQRRLSRNKGVGLTLAAMVFLVFGLTYVKITRGDPMEAFDHSVRPSIVVEEAQ